MAGPERRLASLPRGVWRGPMRVVVLERSGEATMVVFGVIKGGRVEGDTSRGDGSDLQTGDAEAAFVALIIEILHALGRGETSNFEEVTGRLVNFCRHVSSAKRPVGTIVHNALAEAREDLMTHATGDYDEEMRGEFRAALILAAESMAGDSAREDVGSNSAAELQQAIRTARRALEVRSVERLPPLTPAEANARAFQLAAFDETCNLRRLPGRDHVIEVGKD